MCGRCQETQHMQDYACVHGLGAAWDLLGRGHLPTSTVCREQEGTSSDVHCCQQCGLLPSWSGLEKACLFCGGLLEKHQNINPLIYLPVSSLTNLCVMPKPDAMLSFLYDAKLGQVGLGLEHKYTSDSSICLGILEKSCERIWVTVQHRFTVKGKEIQANVQEVNLSVTLRCLRRTLFFLGKDAWQLVFTCGRTLKGRNMSLPEEMDMIKSSFWWRMRSGWTKLSLSCQNFLSLNLT